MVGWNRRGQMDVETSEAIEQLGQRIDAVEVSLRDEYRAGFGEMETRIDSLESRFDQLELRFDGLESRFDTLESRFDRMESRLDERFAESRRHTEVLFDSLRDDIRILVEGFATLSARLDSRR